VFASASCLNASFLDKEKHYNTSNKYPGIDLSKAKDIYNFLSNLNDQFLNELVKCFILIKFLFHLSNILKFNIDYKSINKIISKFT
jgi:hypothetical protein